MRDKLGLCCREMSSLLVYGAIGFILFLTTCATPSGEEMKAAEAEAPVIESIKVEPSPEQTVIEIISSRSTPYAGFKLLDPPRVVLDIHGVPGEELTRTTEVDNENVKEIRFEKSKTQPLTTRMVVDLARAVNYKIVDKDNVITLTLMPMAGEAMTGMEMEKKEKVEGITPEPRIFFKPGPTALNQVLGVDFTMLEHGKSRLIVTTDKKAQYELKRKGPRKLLLTIQKATIPPLLMRRLDSSYFEGVVDRVKALLTDQRVSLDISLREMVPYHVTQTGTTVNVDFSRTSIKPREKTIGTLQLAEQARVKAPTPVSPPAEQARVKAPSPISPRAVGVIPTARAGPAAPSPLKKRYTGTPMTMDFVNADVTNILRLIGEVSNLNIVWGPEVKGTVSMRLKNVPWDQALDLVLANNKLAQKQVGNVIWITTQKDMAAFEASQVKKKEDTQKAVALGPLETAYFTLDFAKASDVKNQILLSGRGSLKVDARTNTIIMKDIASNIEEARKVVDRFDTPVKQIMIEARIVDATDEFTRDLGVRWNKIEGQKRDNTATSWAGQPLWAPQNTETNFPAGSDRYQGTFSSGSPPSWAPNLSFTFANVTSGFLKGLALDASLALAETEGKAKVISAPKVLASNGEKAKIGRGSEFYLAAAENVQPTKVTAELSLEVTPTVSFNNFVSMEVVVTDEQQTSDISKSTKNVSTTLMVKSGETIVIGGIFTEEKHKNESGIPGLRKVPLLGWLFKARKTTLKRTELLIFLTPKVITGKAKVT